MKNDLVRLTLAGCCVLACGAMAACGDDASDGRDGGASDGGGAGADGAASPQDAGRFDSGTGGTGALDAGPAEAGPADDDAGDDEDSGAGDDDTHVFRPEQRPYSDALRAQLELPQGFAIRAFAEELQNPRMIAVADDGTVYVTRPMQGDVLLLRDSDDDGRADVRMTAIASVPGVHGIALHEGMVYLATVKQVQRAAVAADGTFGAPTVIVDGLPDGGQHPNRTLLVGPDGKLYITVGSSCDACPETNPEHATILQTALDGSGRRIFARGLRNTLGFDAHPETQQLWGSDHGSDFRGDDVPPDEINRIVDGSNYGWPYCFGDRQIDPIIMDPPGMTKADYCSATVAAVFEYPAHSAPIGFAFYDGTQFPEEYRGDAFVAFRGSWNRYPATGYAIVRVRFDEGAPTAIEDFVSGFLIEDGAAHFARLAGIAVARDGALLFSDDTNGVLYAVDFVDE